MDTVERAAFLVLLEDVKRWGAICEQVEESGSALDVLLGSRQGRHQDQRQEQQTLFPDLDAHERIAAASETIKAWEGENIHFATFFEDHYPFQLLTIRERPPFITWRGARRDDDAHGIAIIGTRQASRHGMATAREIASALAQRNITVISGLAAGIDTAAHLGAIEAGGRTVAVLGTGLRHFYPPENRNLQTRIADSFMVLSQFLPDAPPAQGNFPMRNAVMSGYAAATIVVEASWRSGARTQARLATQHGRPVYLMESVVVENEWAREYAKRPGVNVARTVDDIVSALDRNALHGDRLTWA
ncbi:MAG: DNA-processing protein DprA [Acidimicrobiales bacterium]